MWATRHQHRFNSQRFRTKVSTHHSDNGSDNNNGNSSSNNNYRGLRCICVSSPKYAFFLFLFFFFFLQMIVHNRLRVRNGNGNHDSTRGSHSAATTGTVATTKAGPRTLTCEDESAHKGRYHMTTEDNGQRWQQLFSYVFFIFRFVFINKLLPPPDPHHHHHTHILQIRQITITTPLFH